MEFSEAKALITVDGARRKGKTAPIKQQVDEVMPDLPCIVVRHTGADAPMADKDAWFDELMEAADAECPAEPLDAEHPLFILYTSGSTAKPKGILHTTGGYLTQVAYTHKARLRPQAGRGRLLVLGRRRLGHRALLHRLRAARQRRDVGDVRGRARLPGQGHLVGAVRALRRDDLLHRADRDPRLHQVGQRSTPSATTSPALRLLGTVGEPINPKAWLWYHKVIGGERCPIVDTWWQTETGGIMITTLAGPRRDEAGLGRQAAAGRRGRGRRTRTARTPAPSRAS